MEYGQMPVGMMIAYVVVAIVLYVAFAFPLMKIGDKKGHTGWFAWIPILNIVLMLQIAEKPIWWLVLILIVPCANIVFLILLYLAFLEAINKPKAWILALLFYPLFLIPMYQAANE
ncbi:MAG: DUF5684 domain-containing protein [Spirochaetes bacterium]|nr:DUF5684 domain-containing protein [Spirochaetota bacterium]